MPDTCPICKQYIGSDGKDEVAAPFISKSSRKVADLVYRDMEQKSEVRAQLAAQETGLSTSDVAHLKVTNMRDNQREGDTAFVPEVNPVSKSMNAAPQMTGFSAGAAQLGIQASAGTKVGPFPRAGTNYIQNQLRSRHAGESAAIRAEASRKS